MEIERETVLVSIAFFCIAAFATFTVLGTDEPVEEELGLEVNSSQEIVTVDFNNRSFNLMLENSAEAAFYLDRDRDGSAERKFETISDSSIHRDTKILDFPENIYTLQVSYRDNQRESGDAWMKIESIRLLR
jgi:hypothetical protein